jgi:hypothetical protein
LPRPRRWKLPLPWLPARFPSARFVDVLRTGSRIVVLALDEAVFREPVRRTRVKQRTGRDLNPQDLSVVLHVLQSAVGHGLVATKDGQSYPLPSERRLLK